MIRHILLYSGLFCFIASCNNWQATDSWNYPEITAIPKSQKLFGMTVVDNYHNLTDLQDTQVQKWLKDQDSLAESYFLNNHLLKQFQERFQELEGRARGNISLIRNDENGNYFYLRYDESIAADILYYKDRLSDKEIKLFDSSTYPGKSKNIIYLQPSYDGSKIALGFNPNEDFTTTILIYDLQAKKILSDQITHINPDFGGVQWLPDSSGIIYLYFPYVEQASAKYKRESFSVIHFLGDNPQKRTPIFGDDSSLGIEPDYFPKVKVGSSLDSYIIGYAAKSGMFYDSFIAKLSDVMKGNPRWKPFFKTSDKVYYNQGEIRGQHFIYRRSTPDGNQLCQVNIDNPNFDAPLILDSGSREEPITQFEITKENIYYIREKFGVEISIFRIDNLQNTVQLKPPFTPGYATFFGESVAHDHIGLGMDGWTSNYIRYNIDLQGKFSDEGLLESAHFPEFQDMVSKQIMVTSHDGVEVPLSLVYKKDLPLDSNNEVFMYVYGAYGESMSPFFSPTYLDWVKQGGILAFPHVRGGGEKGEEWHTQGMKTLKYNSWKDLIACTQSLIKMGYTRKGLVSLYTNSAGGITAGMAVNECPELYSSFIAEVPRLHPFGLESSTMSSSTSYIEYGTVKDSLECLGLVRMDPYLNLSANRYYPATLIMPSNNDDRIPLWDSGKYIAKLQKYNQAITPILMDIDYDSGHENALSYDASIDLNARIFSFAKANMRHR
ncbi:prolyl oligopeptidase family serine peptidase [Arenibacter sp. S6351L]|uniref:prolyl oligopeptidase family serine peptidase n=1 Tax=Arenibacter sp. S6351L TaxID=2926407 RepID=UPI001FF3184F|nr:prolyl oligopeptidase family serine peptidase [Arenibacter sp. S6351L]MCK0135892.1 prolyl oligopeptidase family serine peptidase [Arenibacter sp. S6351L]